MEARQSPTPFAHWVIDQVLPAETVCRASMMIPPVDWPYWIRYDGSNEHRKRTCEDAALLPAEIVSALAMLNADPFVDQLRELTGIDGLVSDPGSYGGGLHVMERGGSLDAHLDFAIHPLYPTLERRINLILFLNERWQEQWNGALDLLDDEGRNVIASVYPQQGRAALFECSDVAFHGVTEPIACPPSVTRDTLAVYYFAPARPGVTRKRSLFIPKRS